MKSWVYTILITLMNLITCLLIGCTNSNFDPNINNLNLSFRTLDKNGNEKNIFNVEDEITLALQGTNISEDTIEIYDSYFWTREINENKDFFLIYKITKNNDKIPIGKPFILPVGLGMNTRFKIDPKSTQYIIIVKWLENPNNAPLGPGNYYCGCSIEIKGKIFKPEINFTIQ